MKKLLSLAKYTVDFFRLAVGTIQTPYQTYRSIAIGPNLRHVIYIALFVFLYLTSATLIRGGLRASPLFLTASFMKAANGVIISYAFSVVVIFFLGTWLTKAKQENAVVRLQRLGVLWSFSLIPTVFWFLTMSVFYYLLPPPRTTALLGQVASAFFIAMSIAILVWKIILYYLTLRFGLRFDMKQIAMASIFFFPLCGIYSLVMYELGIFRIPFL